MNEHIWNYVLNKKGGNYWIHVLYSSFFKVATLCFFDGVANPWCMVIELHEVVSWKGFFLTLMALGPSIRMFHSQQPYWTTVGIHIMARTNQPSKDKRSSLLSEMKVSQSRKHINEKVCTNFWPVLYLILRIIWFMWVLIEKAEGTKSCQYSSNSCDNKFSIWMWIAVCGYKCWGCSGHRPSNAHAPMWKWLTAVIRVELSAQLRHHR